MHPDRRRRLVTAVHGVLAAMAGLVVASVVTLNLHIYLGVEDGYMAGPTQVLERSPWILVLDTVVLVAIPVAAIVLAVRLRGQSEPRPRIRPAARARRPSSGRRPRPR